MSYPLDLGANLRGALTELFTQEFSVSTGHLVAILNGCLFAPSLLTFWFVNGVLDFSTALAIGAVSSPAGLKVRLLAYLLLVPTFLLVRISVHLLHPGHRAQILSGSCPNVQLLSLDWFSVGILATGLPLAVQHVGPWLLTNVVFLVGVFGLPRMLSPQWATRTKLLALVGGSGLFLYANYGSTVTVLPLPSTILGPVATLTFSDQTVAQMLRMVNSVLFGPFLVAAFGVTMNHVLTRSELTDLPFVHHTLPRRDPDRVVVTSAALGTLFYLVVVATWTGRLVFVP